MQAPWFHWLGSGAFLFLCSIEKLLRHIEAIIFSSEKPVTMMELIETLNNLNENEDQFFESEALMQQVEASRKKY
jgi:chromosome segregation and condensation protein ScpB